MIDHIDATEVVNLLSEKTGIKVSCEDYEEWLEPTGNGDYDKFEKAVKVLLTPKIFEAAYHAARLEACLLYKLGLGPKKVGGIDMSRF